MGLGSSFGITSETNNNIQTDGLVGYWDAAYKKSYPRSGTTWTDLAGSNNATLTNGPVHNADGYMTFDGTNDHAPVANIDPSDFQSAFTFNCWVRFHAISGNNIIFGRHVGGGERMYMGINGTDVKIGIGDAFTQSGNAHGMSADRWYNVCVTREGTSNLYFVDLVQKASTTTNWSGTNTAPLYIGSMNKIDGTDDQHTDGDIALVMLYNRTLTLSERTQNYNAQKQRFGY